MPVPMFVNPHAAPPGGLFFYELEGERVEGRCFQEIAPKVRKLMEKHGLRGSAELEIAAYMCPRIGPAASWFCKGKFDGSTDIRSKEAIDNCAPYYRKELVPFDVMERRLERCLACTQHFRGWCLTCTGHYNHMQLGFRGKRSELPIDRGTGVCKCARAYEAAIAAVKYGKDEKIWEGVPDNCWRKEDV